MTTLTAPRCVPPATPFELLLLNTAARIDRFVVNRRSRRAAVPAGRSASAQTAAADARAHAQAHGGLGILPR